MQASPSRGRPFFPVVASIVSLDHAAGGLALRRLCQSLGSKSPISIMPMCFSTAGSACALFSLNELVIKSRAKMSMPARTLDITRDEPIGLRRWMECVLEEAERASFDFSPEPIHDLRVALRRCRSMATGYMTIDPDKTWKALAKQAKRLFKRLGELRDAQVMEEWVGRLGLQDDPVCSAMRIHLSQREQESKLSAMEALREFDRESWVRWIQRLQRRSRRIPVAGSVFQLNALDAWEAAHHLHTAALRSRGDSAFHRLRIGIKKFRYLVENFLPLRHQQWGDDLKSVQDCLGEVHDLTVFWDTAVQIHAFPDSGSWDRWLRRIEDEKAQRIEMYRNKMVGKQSLWQVWRDGLPPPNRLPSLNLSVIQTWASFHGANLKQARDVRRLALQLYDGLHPRRGSNSDGLSGGRAILHAAAVLHEVGGDKGERRGAGQVEKMLQRLPALPGLSSESLRLATLVVHYAKIRLQNLDKADGAGLPEEQRRAAFEIAGILRLVSVLVRNSNPPSRRLIVERSGDSIGILVEDYSELSPLAVKAARARYLLEYSCGNPIRIRNLPA